MFHDAAKPNTVNSESASQVVVIVKSNAAGPGENVEQISIE
jgi:hypothetical protein